MSKNSLPVRKAILSVLNLNNMFNEYGNAMFYEIFIRRAHGYRDRNLKNGADVAFMSNLIDSENDRSNVRHLGSSEKQLKKAIEYTSKAINAFLKPSRKLKPEEKLKLKELDSRLENVYNSTQIMEIIQVGLDITHDYKN